jgi:hypothetical protein
MFFALAWSRAPGWACTNCPHTGVPEIGQSVHAQPCAKNGGVLPVVR